MNYQNWITIKPVQKWSTIQYCWTEDKISNTLLSTRFVKQTNVPMESKIWLSSNSDKVYNQIHSHFGLNNSLTIKCMVLNSHSIYEYKHPRVVISKEAWKIRRQCLLIHWAASFIQWLIHASTQYTHVSLDSISTPTKFLQDKLQIIFPCYVLNFQ